MTTTAEHYNAGKADRQRGQFRISVLLTTAPEAHRNAYRAGWNVAGRKQKRGTQ